MYLQIDDYNGDRSLDDLVKFVSKYSPLDKDADSTPEAPEEASKEVSNFINNNDIVYLFVNRDGCKALQQ